MFTLRNTINFKRRVWILKGVFSLQQQLIFYLLVLLPPEVVYFLPCAAAFCRVVLAFEFIRIIALHAQILVKPYSKLAFAIGVDVCCVSAA